MFTSCSNNSKKIKSEAQSKLNTPVNSDTIKSADSSKVIQTISEKNEAGMKKDSLNQKSKYIIKKNTIGKEAPKHGSPDQTKIDSIKRAKEKLKK